MDNIKLIFDKINIKPNSAVVFDIDETLIDSNGRNITSVVSFYNYVKSKGATPMIVTARINTKKNMKHTIEQLKRNGITGYRYLYLMPKNTNVWDYKASARKHIITQGYEVEMSLGDKPWDIGKYGGIGIIVEKYDIKHQKYIIENYGHIQVSSCSIKDNFNNTFLRVNIPGVV